MIYIVLGRREHGKSTLGLFIARMRALARQILVDPRAQFDSANVYVNPTLEELSNPETPQLIVRLNRIGPEFASLMLKFRRTIELQPDGQQTLLLDEARFLDLTNEDLDWICRCARRDVIDIVITAHRPIDVPVDLRAIADYWCLFAMTQEHDLKVIEERCGWETRVKVSRLKQRQYLVWDDGKASLRICTDPSRWFVPMTQTEAVERPNLPTDAESDEFKLKGE